MKSELERCLDGTSRYCHADKVKMLYETLNSLGNNKLWQLYVLKMLVAGIRDQREAEESAREARIRKDKHGARRLPTNISTETHRRGV